MAATLEFWGLRASCQAGTFVVFIRIAAALNYLIRSLSLHEAVPDVSLQLDWLDLTRLKKTPRSLLDQTECPHMQLQPTWRNANG